MRRPFALAILAVIAAAVVIIAAAGGGSGTTAYSLSATGRLAAPGAVALRRSPPGSILVDPSGRSLYLFEADQAGTSACTGGCASLWPPLTTTAAPVAGAGVAAGKLGTISRAGGKRQVTYGGHPLYTYVADAMPGDTNGQAVDQFGAKWYLLDATGSQINVD